MKIFIDTANLNHINELITYNIISGVTTNPSLMAKEGKRDHLLEVMVMRDYVYELDLEADYADDPVKAQQ